MDKALSSNRNVVRRWQTVSKLVTRSRKWPQAVEDLVRLIGAEDPTIHVHTRRVSFYAEEFAKSLGLSPTRLSALRIAAVLHDIGKLALPEEILNKPGRLSRREFAEIKLHPIIGADILGDLKMPSAVVQAVRCHHERYDGTGYPNGLKGKDIPLLARILTLADFYDALRSDRPYRQAVSAELVVQIIQVESGRMFDPRLASSFCRQATDLERRLHRLAAAA